MFGAFPLGTGYFGQAFALAGVVVIVPAVAGLIVLPYADDHVVQMAADDIVVLVPPDPLVMP